MKTLIVSIIVFLSSIALTAQITAPLRSLTPGNLFIYDYKDQKFGYEKVLRDTTVGGKKYGVVFSSYTNTLRLERSDSLNIYELRNGTEVITQSLAWKVGDTVRFKFLWNGCDTCRYHVGRQNKLYSPISKDTLYSFALNFINPSIVMLYSPYGVWYRRNYGIHQIDTSIQTAQGLSQMIGATILRGALVNGVVLRDTTLTSIQQPTTPAQQQTPQQPFSATRAVSVPVSFSAQHPFSEQTQISYTLPNSGAVEIAVYSMQGIRLTTLRKERQQAGTHNVLWNGKSSEGVDAPSGTYFFVLYFNDQQAGELQVLKTK